jgi:hypothetical protein
VGHLRAVTWVAALLCLTDCSAIPRPQDSASRSKTECSDLPSVSGNGAILRCLRSLSTDQCSATNAEMVTLAGRYDIRADHGWVLLRNSLAAADSQERLAAWKILQQFIGDGFVREMLMKDHDLERALIRSLRTQIADCPSPRTTDCDGGASFYVDERFTALVASAKILSAYQTPEADIALAELSICPKVLPWLVESGTFDNLAEARERALISRLVERAHVEREVDSILDVLELRGGALSATLLEECQKNRDRLGEKCRMTAVAIRERLSQEPN